VPRRYQGKLRIGLLPAETTQHKTGAIVHIRGGKRAERVSTTDDLLYFEATRTERYYWRDLWRYRELFFFLAWRDILVRYKQTVIGILWAVIKPLLAIIVLTVLFGKLAKLPSGGVPYPILVCAAVLPWQFFASAFAEAGNSLIGNANLVSKIYFPRLIIPASAVVVTFVDFLISAVILAGLMVWYGFLPDWRIFLLPLFIVMAVGAALGVGLWIAALNVKYRDFRYIIPVVVQFGLYISPVGFSSSVVPEKWRLLYAVNPMVGVIDGFRWALLGGQETPYWSGLVLSMLLVGFLLITGISFFRRTERSFADVI
jgi:lipopolysaccharide transport system permease protein